jgi:hypothetical protein
MTRTRCHHDEATFAEAEIPERSPGHVSKHNGQCQ